MPLPISQIKEIHPISILKIESLQFENNEEVFIDVNGIKKNIKF